MRAAVMPRSGPWIRGPVWDSIFVLSGLPLGLALLCLTGPWYDWPNPRHYGHNGWLFAFFLLVPFLETGHSISPIALAWSHTGFRRAMLERKPKFILLPSCVFLAATAIGTATSLGLTSYVQAPHRIFQITWSHLASNWLQTPDITNPFPIVVWTYMIWNAYHFGMQNFGVLSIYRKKREEKT